MPGLFSEDLKRRVREASNIVDVVQAAVGKLTRAGRNLKACCPFHREKTPSFNVNPEGQYFNCFGCGKGGDVFTFVMLHERVEFPEALRILAQRAGIPIEFDPKAAAQYKKETDWKSYLYRLNDAAARFFREQLAADAGRTAREYLKKRGLAEATCRQFGLGYAPASGSPLLARLRSQNAPDRAIVQAGLASEREGAAPRDFFYDRLMFPIHDMQGRVIAFGGRILGDGEPKYLNTRETLLFSKTKTVYALDRARDEIATTRRAILVEGYTDVMMCHQFGIANVVACLGTAITAEHVRQLRRVADELLILTDSDAAGAKASERSLGVLFQEEMPARVARLPGADKDPCDFLLAQGREQFEKALQQPLELFEYKFQAIRQKHDLLTPFGLKAAVQELMELISLIPDPAVKNNYRYQVMQRLNVREQDLAYLDRVQAPAAHESSGPGDSATGSVPPPESDLAATERELLRLLLHEPALMLQAVGEADLTALSGGPELQIGLALLAALGEGKLPPDVEALAQDSPGRLVVRELLPRLQNVPGSEEMANGGAQALCIALAETPPEGPKLSSDQKLRMIVHRLRLAVLEGKIRTADGRHAQARLEKDAQAEAKTYEQLVLLRKKLAGLKSLPQK
ncbi:MAG: DNA primase [Planctomycetota bacterium]